MFLCDLMPQIDTNFPLFRFEAQLTAVKERLEAAKVGSTRGLNYQGSSGPGFNFGGAGSRIAKPLRGGGGTQQVNGGPNLPVLNSLQTQEANGSPSNTKRSSWFFSDRR